MISLGITSLFYLRVSRQQAASRPKTKKIVGAAVAMQPGTPVTAENLVDVEWPESVPLEGAITKREDVVGRVLFYPVAAKEPLLERDLASSTSSLGLAAKIPDGMRATAVKTNEVNNIAGFLWPGSKVDVLVTLRGENNTNITRTVLQNVQVLSAGSRMQPDPQGKPENVGVITLLVTPEDSEKLILAEHQGSIQFVLRNGGDSAKLDTPAIGVAQLFGEAPKPVQTEAVRNRKHVAAKLHTVYTVETVAGGKTTVTRFEGSTEPQTQ